MRVQLICLVNDGLMVCMKLEQESDEVDTVREGGR